MRDDTCTYELGANLIIRSSQSKVKAGDKYRDDADSRHPEYLGWRWQTAS